ncbi:MAG: ABC transporter ATP-binding protein [Bacteroidota bacterium]
MKLHIENLSQTYPNGVQALKNVSLEIETGMFGLLGPNGAGKSTLMRILATLQMPDSGSITFGEHNVLIDKTEIRQLLGYLPQEFGVYPKIKAISLLDHLAVLKGIGNSSERKNRVEQVLVQTNLWKHRNKRLGGYSGGMRQRFGIAQALLADPKLIIVDEPTAGLDPAERNRFHNMLSELGNNAVVILSTHIVDDVTKLCPDMAIIHEGVIQMTGSPQEAIEALEGNVWQRVIPKQELDKFKQQYQVIGEHLIAGQTQIMILSDFDPGNEFKPKPADLEDVYFSYISHTQQPVLV